MTALTDSEDEDEQSCEDEDQDELSALLERIDRLRQGDESAKRESLEVLLEQKDQVCFLFLCFSAAELRMQNSRIVGNLLLWINENQPDI